MSSNAVVLSQLRSPVAIFSHRQSSAVITDACDACDPVLRSGDFQICRMVCQRKITLKQLDWRHAYRATVLEPRTEPPNTLQYYICVLHYIAYVVLAFRRSVLEAEVVLEEIFSVKVV